MDKKLPEYICHKKVRAIKIAAIEQARSPKNGLTDCAIIMPAEEGYDAFIVDNEFMNKHKPVVGGYFVIYEDGYTSFSPAAAFESGYTRVEQ